jgi:hypothetical protein
LIIRYTLALIGIAILIGVISVPLARADASYTIDFEGLDEGMIVGELSCGAGITCPSGSPAVTVLVNGKNVIFPNHNTAMIFDAECLPGGAPQDCSGGNYPNNDRDLFFPGHGNTLINSEDLDSSDPDDQDEDGSFLEFDFFGFAGTVTIDSIDVGDVEEEQGEARDAFINFHDGSCSEQPAAGTFFDIPATGNNVIITLPIGASAGITDAHCVQVRLNGSGTIDNIRFTVGETPAPAIDIEKWTRIAAAPAGGDVCETLGKPKTFTLRYTGDNVLDHHQKGDKVKVKGSLNGESPVRITSGKHFDGTVNLGETFDTEKGKVAIKDPTDPKGKKALKEIEFHTSCSQPLVLGDQFGGVQLVGYNSKDGQSATFDPTPDGGYGEDADEPAGPSGQAGEPVIWTYFVTNPGDAPLHDVTVVDDNGTPADTSDDFNPEYVSGDDNGDDLLDLTETWLYQATSTVKLGQYRNIGSVSGMDPNGTEVTDRDPSHHIGVFPAGDACEGKGKPETLTMLYTGGNVQDHSQASGKVNVSGDPGSASPVQIISAERADGTGQNYFDGTVNLGEPFVIDGSHSKLKSRTFVLILDDQNNLLQTIEFHTSCSQPLELGDRFGGIQLIDSTSTG